MKASVFIILLLTRLSASEFAFEVYEEQKADASREQHLGMLLDAYDILLPLVRDGVIRPRHGGSEVKFRPGSVACDVSHSSLKVVVPGDMDSAQERVVSSVLLFAVREKLFEQRLEKINKLIRAALHETDPVRRTILEQSVAAMTPPTHGPLLKIGLRMKNGEPAKL